MIDKSSRLENNEYTVQEDKRHRRKEQFIRTQIGDFNKIKIPDVHGKDHHIEFRISPRAEAIGVEVAKLFKMSLNQYTKAVLYLNLGLIYEPTDRRKRGRSP